MKKMHKCLALWLTCIFVAAWGCPASWGVQGVDDAQALMEALAAGRKEISISGPIRLDSPLELQDVSLSASSPQAQLSGPIILLGGVRIQGLMVSCPQGDAVTVRAGDAELTQVQVRASAGVAIRVEAGASASLTDVSATGDDAVQADGNVRIQGGVYRGGSPSGRALSATGASVSIQGKTALSAGDEASTGAVFLTDASLTAMDASIRGTPALSLRGASSASLSGVALHSQGTAIDLATEAGASFDGPACTVNLPHGAPLSTGEGRLGGVATSVKAPATLQLALGESKPIAYSLVPQGTHFAPLRFESEDPDIAYIDAQGGVTGICAGKTRITLSLEYGSPYVVAVEVTERVPPNPLPDVGQEIDLVAMFGPPEGDADVVITSQEEPDDAARVFAYLAREGGARIFSQPNAAASVMARLEEGALAKVSQGDGEWRPVQTGQGLGYVRQEELISRAWRAADAGFPAVVMGPDGPLPQGTLVLALLTAGGETAVLYEGSIAYLPAECVRLIQEQARVATVDTQEWAQLRANPDSAETLCKLFKGVAVELAGDPQDEWVLVRVGRRAGYLRSGQLLLEETSGH